MKIAKTLCAALMLALALASCSTAPQQTEQRESYNDTVDEGPKPKPVFSVFANTGRCGYLLYRNSERIANITADSSCVILGMRAYKGDCYTLMSRWKNDTVIMPAEIYKNGHPAMSFLPELKPVAFDISDGHFYVMGQMDDFLVVYRDGSRVLSTQPGDGKSPRSLSVSGQTIYIALQCADGQVEVTKGGKHMAYYPGRFQDFKVSRKGCYMLSSGILYCDTVVMNHERHTFGGKDMYADPMCLSVAGGSFYVGAKSSTEGKKYYACVFKDGKWCMTTKPDSRPIDESPMQTVCAGIAACDAGVYMASYVTDSLQRPSNPKVFQYEFRNAIKSAREDCFKLSFDSIEARLMFMETSSY